MGKRQKQAKLFALMLEQSGLPTPQRPKILQAADSFLDSGWTSNDFTIAMCSLVAQGVLPAPPPFREAAHVALYKAQSRNLHR
jgi:hypothetical protein